LTKADYLDLPSVESTHNRCLPCNKSFPNSLRYRIHIKDSHDKKEPTENFDAENCAQPEDFICLICVKKLSSRKSLRIHIYKTHLGSTPEDEKLDGSNENKEEKTKEDEEQDPLADPLDIKSPVDGQESLNSMETVETESNNVKDVINDVDDKSESKDEAELNGSSNIKADVIENIAEKVGDDEKSNSNEKKDVEEMDVDKDTNVEEPVKTVSEENKDIKDMDVDDSTDTVDPKAQTPSADKTELKDEQVPSTENNKDEDDIVIIDEPKTIVQTKILSEKEKKLIEKMLHMLKKYGCAFCSNRFDTKYALSFHERTHLKEKKSPKKEEKKLKPIQTPKKPKVIDDDGTPKVKKNTKMGSVQLHDNVTGPRCFKCDQVCKDNSNYKNHILSHYYREFDKHIPQIKPFECPICSKPSRDKITLIRHYAFTHQKMFELTDITPEQLLPPGSSGTPKTPRAKPNRIANDSTSEMTPKLGPSSPSGTDSPMVTETSSLNEESASNVESATNMESATKEESLSKEESETIVESVVKSNGIDNNELEEQGDKKEESIRKDKEEEEPEDEKEKDTNTEEENNRDEKPLEPEKVLDHNDKSADEENLKNSDKIEEREGASEKMDSFATELSDNKENEEEVV